MTLPKPYYDHNGITIYHGDCQEILYKLPLIDLILTDPPYGVNLKYSKEFNDSKDNLDKLKPFIYDFIKDFPLVMITCGLRNLFDYPKPNWIFCWHKPAAIGRSDLGGFNNWEPILVYGKKRIYQDYYYAPSGNEVQTGDHPCPKPIKLFQMLIQNAEANMICDPFMGSGTTLRAAKDLGRKAIGIEIEEKYCEIAVKRLSQEVLPL